MPLLEGKISLFVPELPGYGISTPIVGDASKNTKRAVGTALLESLASVFKTKSSSTPRKIILGGHDRGARICHRLAVDFSDPQIRATSLFQMLNLTVLGTILLDIVPTREQWRNFSDPTIAQGYFHWPFLANAQFATDIISAYGGAKWARSAHTRISGKNPLSLQRIQKDGALDVYAELFDKKETLYYSALDYAAGAAPEATEQDGDQKSGRKIGMPLLVMFSKANLGARMFVDEIWEGWINQGVKHEIVGVGHGYGHYLPEEAFDIVVPKMEEFLKSVV